MTAARALLLVLLPLFAGCQSLFRTEAPAPAGDRLQGMLTRQGDAWQLQPCSQLPALRLRDTKDGELLQPASELMADGQGQLFADVRGALDLQHATLAVNRLYRLQGEGPGCNDKNFPRLILRASGNEPDWSLLVTSDGLLLERPGEPALALPYLEEQLPEGQLAFTSEANRQRLQLWVTPQRCQDSASGAVTHLSAQLRPDDGKVLRGCAYYGGARND